MSHCVNLFFVYYTSYVKPFLRMDKGLESEPMTVNCCAFKDFLDLPDLPLFISLHNMFLLRNSHYLNK